MGARNKKQGLPKIDGDFNVSKNRINILKWVEYFNDQKCVKSISAPCKLVDDYGFNYPKLARRQYNQTFDFFKENNLYLVVECEIRQFKLGIYLFCDDTVEIAYGSESMVVYLNKYLRKFFPQDKIHSGWKETWNKVQELTTLNNTNKLYNVAAILNLIF